VQARAIPLGKFGADLIVQAKSGTGKTCMFAVIVLESLQIALPAEQALIVSPTRELAHQVFVSHNVSLISFRKSTPPQSRQLIVF